MAQNIEIPVSLGLSQARDQIRELHTLLQNSVKVNTGSFDDIDKMLAKATGQVDKLSGKLKGAFQTSSSSRSFLREYQTMLETLSTIKTKMGNVGFEDIKFTITDQAIVDKAVTDINKLQTSLEQMQRGVAVEFVNQSSISGIQNLRDQITGLKEDVSNLDFNDLKQKLTGAAKEAKQEVTDTKTTISELNTQISTIRTSGLADVKKAVGATSDGITKRIVDPAELAAANAQLATLATTLTTISPKMKAFSVNNGTDITEYISKETSKIESEYQTQITAIRDKQTEVNNALAEFKAGGHIGKDGRQYFNQAELDALMKTDAIKTALSTLKIDSAHIFDKITNLPAKVAELKRQLNNGLTKLTIDEASLEGLKKSFNSSLTKIFDGIGEEIVSKKGVGDIQDKIRTALSTMNIDVVKLQPFGFDISKDISSGQALADIYAKLGTALMSYATSQESVKNTMQATGLPEAEAKWINLTNAVSTFTNVEKQSTSIITDTKTQMAALWKTVLDLGDAYNKLAGSKVPAPDGLNNTKTQIESYIESLNKLQQKQKALGNIQMAVNRWMGFWQVLNMTKKAINDMKQHIQELDSVMTSISVVTNFSQEDLWNQISSYSEIARQYGVAIKGVYEVSQIYYQQGGLKHLTFP